MSDLDNKSKQLTEKELINLGGIIALNKKKEEDKQNKMIELSSLLEEMFQEIPDILKLDNKNQICNKYNTWIQLYLPRSKEYIKILNKEILFMKKNRQENKEIIDEQKQELNDCIEEFEICEKNHRNKIAYYENRIMNLRHKCIIKNRNIEILICIIFFTNIISVSGYENNIYLLNYLYNLIYLNDVILFSLMIVSCYLINFAKVKLS
tara:strand:- start:132 stop:755 length:624 start_codon:yes stop_codon:yes gene_type:complete